MLAYAFYETDPRIQQYAYALTERGDTVDVIALRRKGQPAFEVLDGVRVYRIQSRTKDEKGRLAYLWRILRFLVHSAFVLARRHRAQPYQLIHVHSVPDFLVFAAALPKLAGAPVLLDIHDILPEFYASKFHARADSPLFRLLTMVEKFSIAFSDHVIVANHLWHERLVSRSTRREKCTAIGNYPGLQMFPARPHERQGGRFLITYPGSLNWHQGVDVAIKAFAKVAPQMPEAEFHIYGEGPTKSSLVDLAGQLGLNGKVVFHEFIPADQIVKVMAETDLAVVPKRASSSFGNEAASTKILQFMALGVPVVVSRTKIDSYYHDDSRVEFFDSENEDDLAQHILRLQQDPARRAELAGNAAAYARENSWAVKKHDYLRLVDTLVGASR